MLILAVDTSGREGRIALARGDKSSFELIESVGVEGGTFSAQLVPQIAKLLSKHNLSKQHIEGFAVASGPGSFTGLRVGLAAVKALGEALNKPIAAVSVLEGMAAEFASQKNGEKVFALLDAGRGEVFIGEYDIAQGHARLVAERLVRAEDLPSLGANAGATWITIDQKMADRFGQLQLNFDAIKIATSVIESIAKLGILKILKGDTVPVEELDANYMRQADARAPAALPALESKR